MIKFLYKLQVPQTQANTTICENHVEIKGDEIKGNSQEVQIRVREGEEPVGRADAVGISKTKEEDDLMWTKFSTTKNSANLKYHN